MLDQRSFDNIRGHYKPILKSIILENLDIEHHDSELIAKKREIVTEWGGMMALDNFGMGNNNETAMFTSNPDMIIIDKTLIKGCGNDPGKATVIRNLINLTKECGVLVIAQGMETDEDLYAVKSLGADMVQDFCLAEPEFQPKPVPEDIISKIVK